MHHLTESFSDKGTARVRIYPVRPLMWSCLVFLVSLMGMMYASVSANAAPTMILPLVLCGIGIILFGLLAWLPRVAIRRSFCLVSLFCVLLAFFLSLNTISAYRQLQAAQPETVTLSGVVKQLSYSEDDYASFLLDVDTMDGKHVSGTVSLISQGDVIRYAEPGERVSLRAMIGEESLLSDYQENKTSLFADGIYAYGAVMDADAFCVTGQTHGWTAIFAKIALFCKLTFYEYLPKDTAALVSGLLLGDKSVLSAELIRDFRRIGISHILAVSGIHLSVLVGGFQRLLTTIGISKRFRYPIMAAFLLLFMGTTGFSPSVMRSGFMWILCGAAFLVSARADGLTSLLFAASVICVLSPNSILDVGFLLSVCATAGILILCPPMDALLGRYLSQKHWYTRIIKAILSMIGTTLGATIFILPISLFVFGEISLLAPLANLLIHIPAAGILYTAPLLLLLAVLPLAHFAPILYLIRGLSGVLMIASRLLTAISNGLSSAEHALIGVRYPFLIPVFLVFLIIAILWILNTRNSIVLYPCYVLCCLIFGICMTIYAANTADMVSIYAQTYHKNDIVTVISGGKGAIIDASDGSYTSAHLAWQSLSDQNLTQLDAYVLTHYHRKHTNTVRKLAERVVVRNLILPVPQNEAEQTIYEAVCKAADKQQIPIQTYQRGTDTIVIGTAELSVFPPAWLSRSVQPLLGYTISKRLPVQEENASVFLYLSASGFEADGKTSGNGDNDIEPYITFRDAAFCDRSTKILYLGIHGPLLKQKFGEGMRENAPALAALVFADREQTSFCDTTLNDAADAVYMLSEIDGIRMILQ